MKKEQPDGNLCCIEPAKENVCQASGLFPPAFWILSILKIRRQNGTGREDPGPSETSTGLQATPTLCSFMTPASPRDDTADKISEAGLLPVPKQALLVWGRWTGNLLLKRNFEDSLLKSSCLLGCSTSGLQ